MDDKSAKLGMQGNTQTTVPTSTASTPPVAPTSGPHIEQSPNMASALNTPFSSSHPIQTKSTSTGDIILHPDKPKVDKKTFIIAGIILGVAILVTLIVILIFANRRVDNSASQHDFARYANYLLYGEAKDELTGSYNPDETYEVDFQFYADEYNAEYWDQAKSLLDKSVSSYITNERAPETILFAENLRSYQELFNFIAYYRQNSLPTILTIYQDLVAKGYDETKQSINSYFDSLKDANPGEIAENYLNSARQNLDLQVESLEIYHRYGCTVDAEGEFACPDFSPEDQQRISELNNERMTLGWNNDEYLAGLLTDLKGECWDISEQYLTATLDEDTEEDEVSDEKIEEDQSEENTSEPTDTVETDEGEIYNEGDGSEGIDDSDEAYQVENDEEEVSDDAPEIIEEIDETEEEPEEGTIRTEIDITDLINAAQNENEDIE